MLLHPAWRTILKSPKPKIKLTDIREDVGNNTTYTFTGCNIDLGMAGTIASEDVGLGTANGSYPRSPSRGVVIVAVHGEDSATLFSISTVTIGGVTGTEAADRGGATNAINSGLWYFDTDKLSALANTDIVVTFSEAVTGAAIGVICVTNIGPLQVVGSNNGTGAGSLLLGVGATTSQANSTYPFAIVVSTCATGGGTERFQVDAVNSAIADSHGAAQIELLYEKSNAEFDYGAAAMICQQYSYNLAVIMEVDVNWSGAGVADDVLVAFQ